MRFYRVRVMRTLPHPGRGFTQGLILAGGTVWESSGGYGASALRGYPLGAAQVAAAATLPPDLFAEGICQAGGSLWQLTWRERVALRWRPAPLELAERVSFNREGWGICAVPGTDDAPASEVVTSDGTSELVRRDPVTLEPRAVVHVRCAGRRVRWLNDLAWSGGLVWANVLGTTVIAGIDLASGEVTDVVDARPAAEWHASPQLVMNGIAPLGDGEFLLTGKGWRSIRHVRLVPGRDRGHVHRMLAGPA